MRTVPLCRSALALAVGLAAMACSTPEIPELRQQGPPPPVSDGRGNSTGGPTGREGDARTAQLGRAAAEAKNRAELPLVVFLGDSLTAGYGLSANEAYPAHVERMLADRGLPVRVLNAGVSGDTSAGGLARLDWFLRREPDVVVVALGANDGLRALRLDATEANLRAIVERVLAAGARVVLAGMRMPPNYGPDYVREFAALYPRLAREYDVPLLPFLLEGVAADPKLNLPDGVHPNAEGQAMVARSVTDALAPVIESLSGAAAGVAP